MQINIFTEILSWLRH